MEQEIKIYKLDQISDLTGLSYYAVRQLVLQGKLKAFRIGEGSKASFRVTEKNLLEFLNGEV